MPSAPPMSPLTTSYFTCWAFFDACAGPANETIGTTILEVGGAFGMHPELLRLIRRMQDSRMGFYIHHGKEGNVSILEDLVTTAVYRAIVPTGYSGRKNENWYVRLLPPPIPGARSMSSSRRHTSWCTRTSANGWRTSAVRFPPRRVSTNTSAT
jgi:hypothetical protein